jgi:hypothetical protein
MIFPRHHSDEGTNTEEVEVVGVLTTKSGITGAFQDVIVFYCHPQQEDNSVSFD